MTVEEAYQRGNNLLATAIVALSGFSFLPEFFLEDEWQHKLDEGILVVLGLAAIAWYLSGRNRFARSIVPVGLVALALATKVIGLILEVGDQQDQGDDFGALILFILATITVVALFVRGASTEKAGS